MSTRSAIGFWVGKRLQMIYCHYDGYPAHTGLLLKKYYDSRSAAEELVWGGAHLLGFDLHTGTYTRFRDDTAYEVFPSIDAVFEVGYDYAYVFDERDGWICYGYNSYSDDRVIETKPIPKGNRYLDSQQKELTA